MGIKLRILLLFLGIKFRLRKGAGIFFSKTLLDNFQKCGFYLLNRQRTTKGDTFLLLRVVFVFGSTLLEALINHE